MLPSNKTAQKIYHLKHLRQLFVAFHLQLKNISSVSFTIFTKIQPKFLNCPPFAPLLIIAPQLTKITPALDTLL